MSSLSTWRLPEPDLSLPRYRWRPRSSKGARSMPTVLALAGGSLMLVVFLVVLFFAIAYGYYTKAGSGISQRPSDGRGQAPGADGPSSITTTEGDGDERTVGTHGTR